MINSQGNLNLCVSSSNHIRMGFLSKSILILTTSLYLLSFLNKNFILIYSNIPFFTLNWLEIWRIIIGPFLPENVFDMILSVITILTIFNFIENTKGTLKFSIMLFGHLLFFQSISILFNYSISYFFPVMKMNIIKSLNPLGLSFLIQNIIFSNFKHLNLIRNNEVNNRFLFLFIVIYMIIFNFKDKVDIILSIIYGLIICKYKDLFVINDERLLLIEKHENFKIIANLDGIYFSHKGYIHIEDNLFKNIHSPIGETNGSSRKPEIKIIKDEKKQSEVESIVIFTLDLKNSNAETGENDDLEHLELDLTIN